MISNYTSNQYAGIPTLKRSAVCCSISKTQKWLLNLESRKFIAMCRSHCSGVLYIRLYITTQFLWQTTFFFLWAIKKMSWITIIKTFIFESSLWCKPFFWRFSVTVLYYFFLIQKQISTKSFSDVITAPSRSAGFTKLH